MQENIDEVVYGENVIGFTTLAAEYCNLLDETARLSQKEFIDKAHRLLPLIYLKAIILPEAEPIMPEMIDKVVTHEEWEAVRETLARKLVDYDAYKESLDSLTTSGDEMHSLSEGFADIYQDLRDYLSLYNMGTPEIMNDAIWECKKNFQEYWGQRMVNISRVLHHLLYGGVNLNDKDALSDEDFDPDKREAKGWSSLGYDDEEE